MSIAIDEHKIREELIGGIVYNMSPSPHYRHNEIIVNLVGAFNKFLDKSICRAYADGIDMYLEEDSTNCVIPDVSIICDKNNFKKKGYYGKPKFIAEVLSPATRQKDVTVKKDLYEKVGIEEYWVIDYKSDALDIYHLIEGKYKLVKSFMLEEDETDEAFNANECICLKAFPNIEITLKDVFQ